MQRLRPMTLSAKIAVVDAYEALFGNSAAAIAAALKPAAFAVVMLAVIVLIAVTLDWPGAERLFVPVLLAATSAFAVAWHRRVLLNEVPARVGIGRLRRRPPRVFILLGICRFHRALGRRLGGL
jgi:hypothetical protein